MIKQKLFPSQIRFSIRNLIWFLLEECPFPHWLVWCCRTGSGRGCGRGDTTLISRTNLISLKMFPSGQSGLRRISKSRPSALHWAATSLSMGSPLFLVAPFSFSTERKPDSQTPLWSQKDRKNSGLLNKSETSTAEQEAAQTATNKREKSRLLCSRKPVETLIAINRSGPRDNYMYIHYHRVVLCLSDLMSLRGGKAAGQWTTKEATRQACGKQSSPNSLSEIVQQGKRDRKKKRNGRLMSFDRPWIE